MLNLGFWVKRYTGNWRLLFLEKYPIISSELKLKITKAKNAFCGRPYLKSRSHLSNCFEQR